MFCPTIKKAGCFSNAMNAEVNFRKKSPNSIESAQLVVRTWASPRAGFAHIHNFHQEMQK
jgi:hypothetical protein